MRLSSSNPKLSPAGYNLTRVEILVFLLRNPRWVKHLPDWRRSLKIKGSNPSASTIDLEIPWLTYGAIEWLNNHLTSDMRIFEFGSGGSTIYFSQRVTSVVTVEHDRNWFDKLNKLLENSVNHNNKIICVPPERMDNIPIGYEYSSLTFPQQYSGYSFRRYVETINIYPDFYFDLILVDGRARTACVYASLQKVRKGGYLILDNSERYHYKAAYDYLKEYPIKEYFGFGPLLNTFWRTTIWQIT